MTVSTAAPPPAPEVPRAYRIIQGMLQQLTRLFFREVEVSGAEHVPAGGGGLVVSWHPNGMVDPCLILTQFPRQVVFGARHGLFKWPGLGFLMRRVGCVPIYRSQDSKKGGADDAEARRKRNAQSLDALASEIARGSFSALFPEGVSHDLPGLAELKTGAGRLYYRARQLQPEGVPPPVILPVGLHYDEKSLFQSRAHVCFHEPIALPAELDVTPPEDEDADAARDRARKLTAEIEHVLKDVVHATEDWDTHRVLHRGRKLVRAERAARAGADPGMPRIDERSLGFARVRRAYYARKESDPAQVEKMLARVERYDDELHALGLEDHELDRDPKLTATPWIAAILLVQLLLVVLFLPPILIVGYVVNGPAALLLGLISRVASKLEKDVATVKMLGGAILFPASWAAVGVGGAIAHAYLHERFPAIPDQPILAGIMCAALAAIGAAVALRYMRFAGETWQKVKVRFTRAMRKRAVSRLRAERGQVFDGLMVMAEGLELPGEVMPDGTIRAGGSTD